MPGHSSGEEDDYDDDDQMVSVGKGTAPGTPIPGRGAVLGQRMKKDRGKDPVSTDC